MYIYIHMTREFFFWAFSTHCPTLNVWRLLNVYINPHLTPYIYIFTWNPSCVQLRAARRLLHRARNRTTRVDPSAKAFVRRSQRYLFGGMSLLWMHHVYGWVITFILMSRSTDMSESSRVWMSHVTFMKEAFHGDEGVISHGCEGVMSHIWMCHVFYMDGSCHLYEWVMSFIWMSRVIQMNESFHVYEWVISVTWMSHVIYIRTRHVTYVNESCHVYEWVMSFTYEWVKHLYMNESNVYTWMSHVTYMNESYHLYEWVKSFMYEWVMSFIWMSHVTYMNESCRL